MKNWNELSIAQKCFNGLSKEEIGKVFAYLNSVSFNYAIGNPPKIDKTAFSMRKN